MARNQSQDYATMDDDERRRLEGRPGAGGELDFGDPRDMDNQGHSQVPREEEERDPEHRDGAAAQLDEAAHDEAVDAEAKRRRR
jgi:hypothetical protein